MSWNGSTGANAPKKVEPKAPSKMRGLVALAAVVVIGGVVAALWFARQGEKPVEKKVELASRTTISEATPAVASKALHKSPKKVREKPEIDARLARMSPAERMEYYLDQAMKKPIDFTPSTNRTFKTGTEQVMGWIFTTRLGDMPPPMPRISVRDEAHLADILTANNEILETDSEKAKLAKENVAIAKKELMSYIKEGGDIHEFLSYYREQLMQAHEEYAVAKRSVVEIYRSGEDAEMCGEYLKKVNERLAEKGIKPVTFPQAFFDKFAN